MEFASMLTNDPFSRGEISKMSSAMIDEIASKLEDVARGHGGFVTSYDIQQAMIEVCECPKF